MTSQHPSTPSRGAAAGLLVTVTLVLVAFYYLARPDTIGVLAAGRDWAPMTLRRLPVGSHFAASALLLGLLPITAARLLTGLSFKDLGLGWGRRSAGLLVLAVGVPLALMAGAGGAGFSSLRAVYPLDPANAAHHFASYALQQALYFAAWEVAFRGVLLFGLKPALGGATANAVQTALSVVAHFGRPVPEVVAAVPAGLVFGWVDLQIGSIWYLAVLHWLAAVSLDWFILH